MDSRDGGKRVKGEGHCMMYIKVWDGWGTASGKKLQHFASHHFISWIHREGDRERENSEETRGGRKEGCTVCWMPRHGQVGNPIRR